MDHGVPNRLPAAGGARVQGGDAGVRAGKVTLLKFGLVVLLLLVSMSSLLQLVVLHGSALDFDHSAGWPGVV